MRMLRSIAPWLCLALVMVLPASTAKADEYNKLTIFTFSAPVELPGVVLPAGTYTFKLLDISGNRNVVQVFNKDMTKLYATILTISDYHMEPSDKTVIRFSESAAGGPPAVKEWFYPGDNFGQEFVYPKARAVALAKVSKQPVPSIPEEEAANITKPAKTAKEPSVAALESAPLKAEQPSGGEVEIAEAFATTPPQQAAAESSKHTVNTEATPSGKNLPKTASMLPLAGLAGMMLVAMGTVLWIAARRTA